MLVREEEDHLLVLHSQLVVENLQVFPEGRLRVTPTQDDLKHLALSGKCGQTADTLLAGATHAH